jgi:hypothetical protein
MPFGYLDTRFVDFPAGVDVAYLQGLTTRAGVDFPRLLREIDSRLAALNTGLDPLVAMLIMATTQEYAEANAPSAFEVDERGEYTLARPQLVEGGAHMLPLRGYDVAVGFTEDGLESMSLDTIITNVESMFLGFRRLYRRLTLTRLFSDLEVRVAPRTTVTSPGFAGSGTGNNVFPRTSYPDGTPLSSPYSHYYRCASADVAATIKLARNRLRKWHKGPFDLIAPAAQISAITAISATNPADGFVSAGSPLVRQGSGANEATVDATVYLGVLFGDIRVHMELDDFSSANIGLFKSYGALSPQNPLAWRYDPLKGRGATLRYRDLYPLANAVLKQDLGVGVNDRTAAVLISVAANGNYTPPTFS